MSLAQTPEPRPGTVLILGPRGRFGRHMTRAFAAAGWRVRALARGETALPEGAELIRGDATNPSLAAQAAQGADVVVNALNAPYPDWERQVPRQTAAALAAARVGGALLIHPGNIYPYGAKLPERLTPDTPFAPDHRKARLKAAQELALRQAAEAGEARVLILRAGDYLDDEIAGNWFDSHISARIERGQAVYPGPLDRTHAWAFLPDVARLGVLLAGRRETPPPFLALNLPGQTLTGAELIALMSHEAGRDLAPRPFPWWAIRLAAPFWKMGSEILDMRYGWTRPHRLEDPRLATLAPDFVPSSAEAAVRAALAPRLKTEREETRRTAARAA